MRERDSERGGSADRQWPSIGPPTAYSVKGGKSGRTVTKGQEWLRYTDCIFNVTPMPRVTVAYLSTPPPTPAPSVSVSMFGT